MNRRLVFPLILSFLLTLSLQVHGQKNVTANDPKLARMSQNELNEVADKLAKANAKTLGLYTHRLYKFDIKHDPKLAKETPLRGLFLMRNPYFLKRLSNGSYDDKQGNLIYFLRIKNKEGKSVHSSLTFAVSGEVVLAFDVNGDGIVDGMVGRTLKRAIWELQNGLLKSFWRCFDSNMSRDEFNAAGLCMQSGSSGSGKLSGDETTSFLESFVGALGQPPNCKPVDLRGPISEPPILRPEDVDVLELRLLQFSAYALSSIAAESGDLATADLLEDAGHIAGHAADARESASRATNTGRRERYMDAYRQEIDKLNRTIGEIERRAPETAPQPFTPRQGGIVRPIGPDGQSEDPRCAGIRTDTKRGTLFMNKQFCGDDDPITCYERSADAVIDLTQGRCHTETDSSDRSRLVCEKQDDPLAIPSPESPPGPADGPARGINISPRQKLDRGYMETTPLGGIVLVLCRAAEGGLCGGGEASRFAPAKNKEK